MPAGASDRGLRAAGLTAIGFSWATVPEELREFAPISTAKRSDSGSTPEPRRPGVAWPRLRGHEPQPGVAWPRLRANEPQPPTDPPPLMATQTWPCHPDVARGRGGVHREVSRYLP